MRPAPAQGLAVPRDADLDRAVARLQVELEPAGVAAADVE
jgi:hypothetical protein